MTMRSFVSHVISETIYSLALCSGINSIATFQIQTNFRPSEISKERTVCIKWACGCLNDFQYFPISALPSVLLCMPSVLNDLVFLCILSLWKVASSHYVQMIPNWHFTWVRNYEECYYVKSQGSFFCGNFDRLRTTHGFQYLARYEIFLTLTLLFFGASSL